VHSSAPQRESVADEFGEKTFYLEEFRSQTLCFSVSARDGRGDDALERFAELLGGLIENDTRIVLLLGTDDSIGTKDVEEIGRSLQKFLVRGEASPTLPPAVPSTSPADLLVDLSRAGGDHQQLEQIWSRLRESPIVIGAIRNHDLIVHSRRLAGRLRVPKWVVAEPAGGIATASGDPISFMDDEMLTTVLRAGTAEWAGMTERRQTLQAIQGALRDGVAAVNLCALDQIERELYTYEGSGTLFTLEDYCRIERLAVDDFEEVERLLERGRREGFLKRREPAEIGQILLNGFGATIGTHLAGVCGLLTQAYSGERAAEISGLYTITRFKSEGVGARLLARAIEEAAGLGLRYVFACTVDPRAADFFQRNGFHAVRADQIPAAKWKGYDASRRDRVHILRRDLRP
jgi:amino-acid N-acetyltransferase